jgi:hypothetical protein
LAVQRACIPAVWQAIGVARQKDGRQRAGRPAVCKASGLTCKCSGRPAVWKISWRAVWKSTELSGQMAGRTAASKGSVLEGQRAASPAVWQACGLASQQLAGQRDGRIEA